MTDYPQQPFQRVGYAFTPTADPATREPGPLHVSKDGVSTAVQPDFLDGRDDDTQLAAFLDVLFDHLRKDAAPGSRGAP